MGLPMVSALFGQETLAYAIIYDQLGNFLGVSLVAAITIAAFDPQQPQPDKRAIVLNVFHFPPFLTLLAGLLLPVEAVVNVLHWPLALLAQLIIPLTMLSIGLQFRFRPDREHRRAVLYIIAVKMALLPLMVWLFGLLVRADAVAVTAAAFQAAMPPMVTAAVLLMANRMATGLVVAALGMGTLLSFVSLPLLGVVVG